MVNNCNKTAAIMLSLAAILSWASPARAQENAGAACRALQSTDFSTVQDAPTQVMAAELVDARGDMPAHCHVEGYVVPQVGIDLKLPAAWNGKFLQVGCGGLCGSTRFKEFSAWCEDALRRGYACVLSDRGHSSSRDGAGNAGADGLWAHDNLQGKIDYGFRGVHVATLAGKAITSRYYDAAPKYSFYMGCSGGGRGGLMAARLFPWDFDGIVAIDPGPNLSLVHMTMLWSSLATVSAEGRALFSATDIDVLHQAVLGRCDGDDGLKDGIIGDPGSCKFDPAELLCTAGKTPCLSQEQVTAARKLYSGPVTSKGERLFYGAPLGSEKGSVFRGRSTYSKDFFRYLAFMPDAGPTWNARNFDFDADYKRLAMTGSFHDVTNPDLRRFKDAGGKLMIVQGWAGTGSPLPFATIDYYRMMERTMGGRAETQSFARLFMPPGMDHCVGGVGANAFDYMGHLEAWVERGHAPDVIVGAHVESSDWGDYVRPLQDHSKAKFTRSVYPFPTQARYVGTGDPNDHRNFRPVRSAEQ